MATMKIIGLTGGIASGKSTVTSTLEQEGQAVIDADKIAREVVLPGRPAYRQLVAHFGEGILEECGEDNVGRGRAIDRAKLSAIVFSDEKERKVLNGLTHGAVGKEMLKQMAIFFLLGYSSVILDVPLLYESKMDRYCSSVVVINVSPDNQIERLRSRNPELGDEAQRRIDAQMPLPEKCKRATHVIDNNGSIEETRVQVLHLLSSGAIPRTTVLSRALRIGAALALVTSLAYAATRFL